MFNDVFAPAARPVLVFLPSGPVVGHTLVVDGHEVLDVAGVRVEEGRYQTFVPGGVDGSRAPQRGEHQGQQQGQQRAGHASTIRRARPAKKSGGAR